MLLAILETMFKIAILTAFLIECAIICLVFLGFVIAVLLVILSIIIFAVLWLFVIIRDFIKLVINKIRRKENDNRRTN